MAMFREHVAVGAIISMVVVVAVYFYALVTDPLLLLFLFAITIVGSFLPDVDSDSGMPFYLVYGTATLGATGVVLLYTLSSDYAADWRYLTGIPAAALFIFWFIVGGIVKRCTHHRGIFHSLPALAIASLGTLLVARYYGLNEIVTYAFAGGMGAGFLSHLILDELHAGITLDGIPFNTKSSFGSALKLFSDSSPVNTATYLILAVLVYTAMQTPIAEAIFYNDSDVVEIEDGTPPPPSATSSVGTDISGGGGSVTVLPGTSGNGSSNNDDESDDETESGGAGTGGASEEGSSVETTEEEDEVIESLVEAGALSGAGVLSAGNLAGSAGNGPLSGSGRITVNGARAREALGGTYDLASVLRRLKDAKRALSAREYGLVAAGTALGDRNIQSVSFTADKFEVMYRSRGYLLGFIPISFPVRIAIIPDATDGRVSVKLPWYRFFVREFFTVERLTADINAEVVSRTVALEEGEDAKLVLFTAVSDLLRQKVGTLSETIYLQ